MEVLQNIDSMTWLIIAAAIIICISVLFAKAIKNILKIAVIGVMILLVGYFLIQARIIVLP